MIIGSELSKKYSTTGKLVKDSHRVKNNTINNNTINNNPTKHIFNNRKGYIGTFTSQCTPDGDVKFGWSRYNWSRERQEGIPFNKKTGRLNAEQSFEDEIIIDTEKGDLQKGNIIIHDSNMVSEAVSFTIRIQNYFKKNISNVKIIFSILYLQNVIQKLVSENRKLRVENMKLKDDMMELISEYE